MRVRLKGLHRVRMRLADGTITTYWYAWRGGPRLNGEPGSSEFMLSYNAAVARNRRAYADTLDIILDKFQDSEEFLSLAPRTQSDYRKLLRAIANEFGDFPISALPDDGARGIFHGVAGRTCEAVSPTGRLCLERLARIFSWALDRRLVEANPCEKGRRLYNASRGDKVWSDEDEAAFMRVASEPLRLAMILALWTGQRQGDLLRLPWSAYDGQTIRLKQGKTGARVTIPVGAPLKAALDATKKRGPLILMNTRGRAWTANGFHASWRKACMAAEVSGLTFHDPARNGCPAVVSGRWNRGRDRNHHRP